MKKRQPTELPKSLANIDVKALLRRRGIYTKLNRNLLLKEAAKPIARKMLTKKTEVISAPDQLHPIYDNERVMAFYEKQLHNVEVVERHFHDAILKFLNNVQKHYLSKLEVEVEAKKNVNLALSKFKTKDVFDENEEDWLVQAQFNFTPLLDNLAVIAGQDAYDLIDLKEPYITHEKMRAKIRVSVDKFTKSMLDTDQQILTDIIADGVESGMAIPEIRSHLTSVFDEFSKNQANRITRTEVLRVSNQSTLDAYEQSGVVEGKQWLTAGATDECADYEGQIETLSGNFYDDTSEFADGDPPLHPNCRCVLLPVLVGEKQIYQPKINKALRERIVELESQLDKRRKDAKKLIASRSDDKVYINSLEKYLGVKSEPEA